MSITFFFRPLVVALLLFEGGLQAQPLAETYKRQEELRLRVAEICDAQYEKAQYHPVEGQEDLRYMISAKGVQAIKAVVIPASSGGSYKCDRGRYEQPMLLGRTYTSRNCSFLDPSRCAGVKRERLELEPCVVRVIGDLKITTSCLTSYTQFDGGLVDKQTLAARLVPPSE
jgi:hypothetical protein